MQWQQTHLCGFKNGTNNDAEGVKKKKKYKIVIASREFDSSYRIRMFCLCMFLHTRMSRRKENIKAEGVMPDYGSQMTSKILLGI